MEGARENEMSRGSSPFIRSLLPGRGGTSRTLCRKMMREKDFFFAVHAVHFSSPKANKKIEVEG
jgi:hypothetical protein